ncbi:hypothetical protein MRX96_006320 [Rhipicephalus microplus]
MPAAAQSDQACPINDHLSRCNELLFDIGIELREQRGGSLSLSGSQWNPTDFVLPLSEATDGKYILLDVQLYNTTEVGADARSCLFRIRERTRKNCLLVERAAAFKETTPLDWCTANALEKTSRHPALVKELAEKDGIAPRDVARMVRSRLRSVDGLHDFMRLTGVVKKRVVCSPSVDTQLHDLNTYCWRVVRQYLSFDDVRRSSVAAVDSTMSI